MSQYAATLEFQQVNQGAQSPGSIASGAEASHISASYNLVADPDGGAGAAIVLPDLWGCELVSAEVWREADGNALRTFGTSYLNWLAMLAAGNSIVANAGGEFCLNNVTTLAGPPVTLLPQPVVKISGAALAAVGWAIGEAVNFRVTYRRAYPEASGPILGTFFIDSALGESAAAPTSFLRRVEGATQGGVVQIAGVPALPGAAANTGYLPACTMIANDPAKVVFVAPSDIGAGVYQIPTAIANNNATSYGLFPSVFMMRAMSVAGVRLVDARAQEVAVSPGQLAILRVDRAPTHSRWEVCQRGQRLDVIVAHPAGSDLRSAKAAFVGAWAPYLGGGAIGAGPVTYRRTTGGAFIANGVLNNCAQIDALRFVEPLDSNANIWSVYYQT